MCLHLSHIDIAIADGKMINDQRASNLSVTVSDT